ncbi:MAG: hypothetical protein HKN11_01965 [Rhizobiales bacterium]|nr:hypothetical protein [Hyphomicrobiales bacterium]
MTQHYSRLAKFFHWLTAVAVIALLGLGWYMTSLELSPLMLKLYSWHKWIGISVLLVTVLRLIWRFTHPAPPLPADMPPLMRTAAHGGHVLLYALLIGLPIAGWINSSAAGFPVVWFSVIPLPNLVGPSKQISDVFSWLHWAGGLLLVALLVGHIGAALWHHKVKRDDTLVRMLPRRRSVAAFFAAAVLFIAVPPSEAGPLDTWTVETGASEVTFTAQQMNVPVKGKFNAYRAAIVFNADRPDKASIRLEFDTSSITTGNVQADQALPGADWFSAADHPVAVFEASGFKPIGDDTYEVAGTLTVKGTSQPVTVKTTIATSDDPQNAQGLRAQATGVTTISRTAFKVGQGQWANTATIADEVIIAFSLKAARAR